MLESKPEESGKYQSDMKRLRTRKLPADESRENEIRLNGRQKLKVEVYFSIPDKLLIEFKKPMFCIHINISKV